jgi:hypothetical protein
MLLLIDIFSINKGQGYENPILEIIVIECCSIGGCPLKEAYEHCFLNQSVICVVVLISFMCYCGDYAGYIIVILPFLAFYFCFAYLLYLVYFTSTHIPLMYIDLLNIPQLQQFHDKLPQTKQHNISNNTSNSPRCRSNKRFSLSPGNSAQWITLLPKEGGLI